MKSRSFAMLTLLCSSVVVASSCASTTSMARPSAFPGATRPAMSSSAVLLPDTEGNAVVNAALNLLGVDYRYGGEDPATGLDCSGLVRYVFGRYQVTVPRTVEEQFGVGEAVARSAWSNAEAGDLIFFTTTGPGATHVGIVLGADRPGYFVHAPGTGGEVRVDRFDEGYWTSRIVGVRRLLGPHPTENSLLPLP